MESVESRPKLLITGWSFVMGAGMLNVIAIGTPYWIYSSAILRVNYAGLWVFCTKYYLNAVAGCVELDSDFGWVKSIRAMMILSVMFFGAGFVSFTLKIWVLKTRKEFEYLGIASTFAGAVFTLVADSRFADMKEMKINSDYSLSFSFVFSILGMILALVACGLVVIHIRKSSQPATSSDFT